MHNYLLRSSCCCHGRGTHGREARYGLFFSIIFISFGFIFIFEKKLLLLMEYSNVAYCLIMSCTMVKIPKFTISHFAVAKFSSCSCFRISGGSSMSDKLTFL